METTWLLTEEQGLKVGRQPGPSTVAGYGKGPSWADGSSFPPYPYWCHIMGSAQRGIHRVTKYTNYSETVTKVFSKMCDAEN